jgi:hypothetical protein
MLVPYIGITDFTCFSQVRRMLAVLNMHKRHESKRVLHIGVMMSYKTLNGLETKWSKAFPPSEGIADIFRSTTDVGAYYCLHYADYDHMTKPADLDRALEYAGPNARAIQLDMPWPDPDLVASIQQASGGKVEVILQIGKNALVKAGDCPSKVVKWLSDYEGAVHRVLLDKSMRRGLGMNAQKLMPFARAIHEAYPAMGLSFAGGLGPETIHLVKPLITKFPNASIDAQGRLRPSGNALDPIAWDMAATYLVRALELMGEARSISLGHNHSGIQR